MRAIAVFLFCLFMKNVEAVEKLTITVYSGMYERTDCAVSVDVSQLEITKQHSIELYEVSGKEKTLVPAQLVNDKNGKMHLHWIMEGKINADETKTFIAKRVKKKESFPYSHMQVEDNKKALILKRNEKTILQYNYAHVEPPEGIDKAYGRSGFIHPLYSPGGNTLTTIQPKDHYHHYGIWNPWTRILYDGKTYDLWNLKDKQGTVRASGVEHLYEGPVFTGYTANHGHYIFNGDNEKIIINEKWKIKAWNTNHGFLWDFESHLSPSTSLPVLIKEYRYAGFGYRATEEWTKENCEMRTSEGKTRQQIDGTRGRWIYITGETKTGRSGILFMGHPRNYNFPEPLRIWDENANGGRGDAFINFAPTKNKDWQLNPGEHYLLRYRILSYEGEMTPEKAESLWNDFAHPPVTITTE